MKRFTDEEIKQMHAESLAGRGDYAIARAHGVDEMAVNMALSRVLPSGRILRQSEQTHGRGYDWCGFKEPPPLAPSDAARASAHSQKHYAQKKARAARQDRGLRA